MQSGLVQVWTRVAVSISYDDNHYTTGTSFFFVPTFFSVDIALTGYCNQSFFALFCIFTEFLNCCIYAILNTGQSSSDLFSYHICLCYLPTIRPYVSSSIFLFFIHLSSSLIHFMNDQEYLIQETAQIFIPLMRFLLQNLVSRSFLVLLGCSFFTFSCSSGVLLFIIFFSCSEILFFQFCSFLWGTSFLIFLFL